MRRVYTSVWGEPKSSIPSRKNGRFSGKKESEAFVHRHLASVGLHLAEVGVERGVEGEAGEAEPQIDAGVRVQIVADEPVARVAAAVGGGGHERLSLDRHPTLQVSQSAERALLAQEAGVRPPNVGPGVGVTGALDDAGDVEAPHLGPVPRVAETLERNADLDLVAALGDAPLRLPGEVGILIATSRNEAADLAGALAANAVGLGAQRVHPKEERSAAVVERVEVDHDMVVVVDVVAVGYGCADGGRIPVVGDDAEVDRIRRVPDQHLGLLLGRSTVDGLVLPEPGEAGRLRPRWFIEIPVDLDGHFQAGNLRGWRALALDDCRGDGSLEQ